MFALIPIAFAAASLLAIPDNAQNLSPEQDRERRAGELSHKALFAPNKEFPYFESYPTPSPEHVFSLHTAAALGQCSLLAYVKEPEFIAEKLLASGYYHVEFFDKRGTFAFLAESDSAIILSFRGTESSDRIDYFTDAKIIQSDYHGTGTAHSGFIKALSWIYEDIERALADIQARNEKPLWITGHSLGGALATLFGIRYESSIAGIYTIGCPRVGGIQFAENAERSIPLYRIEQGNDLATRVPTPPFYKHIGSSYYIATSGELLVDPKIKAKWKSQREGHAEHLKRLFQEHWKKNDFSAIPSDYFVDHSPTLYVEALIGLAERKAEREDR